VTCPEELSERISSMTTVSVPPSPMAIVVVPYVWR
jgi:hypothetical protein